MPCIKRFRRWDLQKKQLKTRLEKLNDQSRKDDVVTFEELGVDRLFIDESHYYKNLFLYTIQRYLQNETLRRHHLQHFDAWASTFGETVTAIELAPEGTGYRAKTRFAKFYNLPELMTMFKEVADIQTVDMLHLPVPKAEYHNVSVKPSDFQKKLVALHDIDCPWRPSDIGQREWADFFWNYALFTGI